MHLVRRRNKLRYGLVSLLAFAVLCPKSEARLERSPEERAVARLIAKHPNQGRARMTHDAHLHLVARAKARDLAKRDYFGHIDPDGYSPNQALALTGYGLPDHYRGPNNIESLVAGTDYTPKRAFAAWLESPGHRPHILAKGEFYEAQTRFAVGYAKSARSRFKNYYVFLSAPPTTNPLEAVTKSLRKLFLSKTPKQIENLQSGGK